MIDKEIIKKKIKSNKQLNLIESLTFELILKEDPSFENQFKDWKVFSVLASLERYKRSQTIEYWEIYLNEKVEEERYEIAAGVRDIIAMLQKIKQC